MNAHITHPHHHHQHAVSDVMIGVVAIGLAFTVVCIAILESGAGDSDVWHTLAVVIGIPSALTLSFVCLRRGWEDSH